MANDQEIARALYRRLLRLYPRAFREQLGESMEQTFGDLYAERKRRADGGLFGLMLWMFFETALGAIRERAAVARDMSAMKTFFAAFRLPATLSFLLILPFILLELTSVLVKRLRFDAHDALDSLVIFGMLWVGLGAILLIVMPLVRTIRAGDARDPAPAHRSGPHAGPAPAALIGFLLALPFLVLLALLVGQVEPALGPLEPLLNNPDPDQPNVRGTLIVLGAFALAVAGCVVARAPVVRTLRAGAACSPTRSTWRLPLWSCRPWRSSWSAWLSTSIRAGSAFRTATSPGQRKSAKGYEPRRTRRARMCLPIGKTCVPFVTSVVKPSSISAELYSCPPRPSPSPSST